LLSKRPDGAATRRLPLGGPAAEEAGKNCRLHGSEKPIFAAAFRERRAAPVGGREWLRLERILLAT
jgi:hypothetical protein